MKVQELENILTFEKIDNSKLTKEDFVVLEEAKEEAKREKRYMLYYYLHTFLHIQSFNSNAGYPIAQKIKMVINARREKSWQ
ncbi:hypothetical protein ACU3L3_14415 [Priestia endophytica]